VNFHGTLIFIGAAATALTLFFGLRFYFERLVERRIATYQEDLLNKHFDEVQNMYRQVRGWRHDYHNHIQVMKANLALSQYDMLERYLGDLDTELRTVDTVLKTGNVMLDAIVNSKLSLARNRDIQINAKAAVPETLSVSPVELCVVIGNLMDNALEACEKLQPEKRFIRLYIGVLKGQLYLSVTNSAAGFKRRGKEYLSTKDSASHGFGLLRVDRIVKKYSGYVNRQSEEGVFATEIMLPL